MECPDGGTPLAVRDVAGRSQRLAEVLAGIEAVSLPRKVRMALEFRAVELAMELEFVEPRPAAAAPAPDHLLIHEIALARVREAAGEALGVGKAVQWLRAAGGGSLATRLRSSSTRRNMLAHPDPGFLTELEQFLGGLGSDSGAEVGVVEAAAAEPSSPVVGGDGHGNGSAHGVCQVFDMSADGLSEAEEAFCPFAAGGPDAAAGADALAVSAAGEAAHVQTEAEPESQHECIPQHGAGAPSSPNVTGAAEEDLAENEAAVEEDVAVDGDGLDGDAARACIKEDIVEMDLAEAAVEEVVQLELQESAAEATHVEDATCKCEWPGRVAWADMADDAECERDATGREDLGMDTDEVDVVQAAAVPGRAAARRSRARKKRSFLVPPRATPCARCGAAMAVLSATAKSPRAADHAAQRIQDLLGVHATNGVDYVVLRDRLKVMVGIDAVDAGVLDGAGSARIVGSIRAGMLEAGCGNIQWVPPWETLCDRCYHER